jgi:cbb3-type cytochrome oxidase subunit 3
MIKKNLSIILIVLLALLLIAIVIWVFDKRIERIKEKAKPISVSSTVTN